MKKIIVIIIAAFVLVGCSSSKKSESGTKTIEIAGENIEIPSNPQRIVADYYVGELIMLDANLVGADFTYSSTLWGDISDIENVGQSMEAVAGLEPDLIITINEEYVDQYKEIATTVVIPYGTYNPEELVLKLSEITNTEKKADEWADNFNSNIEELKEIVDEEETWTILELNGEGAYFYGEHYGRSGYILYDKLGLKSTQEAEEQYVRKADSYLNATVESMPDLVGDNLILVYPPDVDYTKHHFLTNDVWNSLDAVKQGNVYYVQADDFWYLDPFSLDKQVEVLKEIFNEKNQK